MLQTLKNGDQTRTAAQPAQEVVVDWSMPEPAEVPFIEVGGPRKMDASPQVLAAPQPAQPRLQPPHAPTEKALASTAPVAAARAVEVTPARPMSVAFEAWPTPRKLGRTVAGEVIAYHQPDHPISRQYALLLEQMTQTLRDGRGVLLLAGIRSLVGTTTVLLNLAVACARQKQQRVVVWEAAPAKTAMSVRLGVEAGAGVAEVLCGAAALEKAILEGPAPGLFLLPAQGDDQRGVATLCSPEAARWLLSWLRDRFDLVLIDGPNLDNSLALGVLAPLADELYLVAPQTEKHLLHPGLAQTIARLGGRLRGLVHTQFEV
ncbi:MAG: cellulose synthase operon protein YhjQ/BcsQ [Gemmataceae bacterium]